MGQVLSNLLGNAIAHGEPNGLVAMRIDGGDPASVRIEPHDLGSMAPELLPVLFVPFVGRA